MSSNNKQLFEFWWNYCDKPSIERGELFHVIAFDGRSNDLPAVVVAYAAWLEQEHHLKSDVTVFFNNYNYEWVVRKQFFPCKQDQAAVMTSCAGESAS